MERAEAVSYLREILCTNNQISPYSITLEEPNDSKGYKVRIKGVASENPVKEIAKKHDLAIKEEDDEMIVYKP